MTYPLSKHKAASIWYTLYDMAGMVPLHLPDKAVSQFEEIALEARSSTRPVPAQAPLGATRGERKGFAPGTTIYEEEWTYQVDDALEEIAREAYASAHALQNVIDDDEAYEEDDEASDEAVSTIESGLGDVEEAIEVLWKTVEARP